MGNGTDLTFSQLLINAYEKVRRQLKVDAMNTSSKSTASQHTEIKTLLEAFLNKYACDRTRITIEEDFQFEILGLTEVEAKPETIALTQENQISFAGKANAHQKDAASDIGSSSLISFRGVATYTMEGKDITLTRVKLYNIQYKK